MAKILRSLVMQVALKEVGREDYYGDKYWDLVYPILNHKRNNGLKSQYCAGGFIWTERIAGLNASETIKPGLPGSLWVPSIVTANRNRRVGADNVKMADAVCFDWEDNGLADHIERFYRWTDKTGGWFEAVGFNTSKNGDGSKVGVWIRKRHISDVIAFIDRSDAYVDDVVPPINTAVPTVMKLGDVNSYVGKLQAEMNRVFPSYSKLKVDNSYGYATYAVIAEFQRRARIGVDGTCGPLTQKELKKYGVKL